MLALSARPTTCLAAEGKIRALTPPEVPRKIDQPSAVVSTRTLPSGHAGIKHPCSVPFYHTCTVKSDQKMANFPGGVRWAAKNFLSPHVNCKFSNFSLNVHLATRKLVRPLLGARLHIIPISAKSHRPHVNVFFLNFKIFLTLLALDPSFG